MENKKQNYANMPAILSQVLHDAPDVQQGTDDERRRWTQLAEALSKPSAALNEEQRQIRTALVDYFSILQEWARETEQTDSTEP